MVCESSSILLIDTKFESDSGKERQKEVAAEN